MLLSNNEKVGLLIDLLKADTVEEQISSISEIYWKIDEEHPSKRRIGEVLVSLVPSRERLEDLCYDEEILEMIRPKWCDLTIAAIEGATSTSEFWDNILCGDLDTRDGLDPDKKMQEIAQKKFLELSVTPDDFLSIYDYAMSEDIKDKAFEGLMKIKLDPEDLDLFLECTKRDKNSRRCDMVLARWVLALSKKQLKQLQKELKELRYSDSEREKWTMQKAAKQIEIGNDFGLKPEQKQKFSERINFLLG